MITVAVLGDRHAPDQFHDEERAAGGGGADIEEPGDVRMLHDRQGLALGLETGDNLSGVHSRLDDLERHLAPHRVSLLGHEDASHAPFADLLEQPVRADHGAGTKGDPRSDDAHGRVIVEDRRVIHHSRPLRDRVRDNHADRFSPEEFSARSRDRPSFYPQDHIRGPRSPVAERTGQHDTPPRAKELTIWDSHAFLIVEIFQILGTPRCGPGTEASPHCDRGIW